MNINTDSYGKLNQNLVKRIQDTITNSLKAKIEADLLKKKSAVKRVHPCRVRHIRAREFNQCGKEHYHVALLFNREAYAYPRSYTQLMGIIPTIWR